MPENPAADGWDRLVDDLSPHVSPMWTRHAREHGHQPWVRLVALVDAHHQLSTPMVSEKVANAMADLAAERDAERAGWQQISERAKADREALQARLVDVAPTVLPETLMAYFDRSIVPA
jgi:hypothetical protein